MSLQDRSVPSAARSATAKPGDVAGGSVEAMEHQELAANCQQALQGLFDKGVENAGQDECDALVIQALLDGTGYSCAGVARFSDNDARITVIIQGRARPLLETTTLDVMDVASARAILGGGAVGIAECSDKVFEDDALILGLGMASFFAEPLVSSDNTILGFLFVANDVPVDENTLALSTFLASAGTWLLKSTVAQGAFTSLETGGRTDNLRSNLLVETLQHMGRGVILFDLDFKVTAVNEQTLELLDAPESVLHVGATMDELIEFFGNRGDYGSGSADEQIREMRQMIADSESRTYERHLPNGKVISCKTQPRADGYVITYTDVTEAQAKERTRLAHEELLSDTLNHMEQGLIVFDADLDILAMNTQVNAMLDIPETVLHQGGSMEDMLRFCAERGDYGEGTVDEIMVQKRAMLAGCEPYTLERRFEDGRSVVCNGRPRSDGGYITTFSDITNWRKSERELNVKTELLSAAFTHMDQGLVVYDSNLVIEAFNDRARQLFDLPEHVLQIGGSMVTLAQIWITRSAGEAPNVDAQVLSAQQQIGGWAPFSIERDMPSGRTILCTGRPRDNGGSIVTLSDVTEARNQQRELAEKTALLEATLQHMDQGLFAFDANLKILFANERVKMMLGVPRECLEPGKSFEEVVKLSAEKGAYGKGANDATAYDMLAKAHGTVPFSFERRCAGNTTALVRSHPRPQGGFIVTYTDITAAKRQQVELSDLSEKLRQKSVQLDKVFTNMGNGIAMFDADCNLVIHNPRYQEMFQFPDDVVKPGTNLAELMEYSIRMGHECDTDTLVEKRVELARSRETRQFDVELSDGRVIHTMHAPLDDGGSIAVYDDVTMRVRAEQKLREYAGEIEEQRKLLQTVMETIDQGISLVDEELTLQAFNPQFLNLLEFPAHKFAPGDHMSKFFRHNAERGEYGQGDPEEQVRERLELAGKFEAHCFVRERPDGTAIEIKGTPLKNRRGFVTTYTDITADREHAREVSALTERLTEANMQLDAAFNSMNQGLAMFDADHKLVVRNKRYLEIFRFPEELAVEGASLEDITRYSVEQGNEGDPENAIAKRMEIAAQRERALYHRLMADGRVLEIIHEPLAHGGSLALYLDVTDRDRAERSLREHAAKLEASNRELQDFAYVASHDLQEPLRKIEAFGDRLHKKCGDRLGEDGRLYVDRMQDSSRRLRSLINDLLDYSRVTTKAVPFSAVDLKKLALEVMSDLETAIEDADGSVVLGELPTIEADAAQLRQLFLNMLSNSLKFRRDDAAPEVRIDATIQAVESPEGDKAEICVLQFTDNGIGFDTKYADRIFTIFQRLHSRAEYEGTGIGLATCRKIAERHNGLIEAEGRPGEGAVFRVMLPVSQNSSLVLRREPEQATA